MTAPEWPSWLPADGSSGVPHFAPGTADRCRFNAIIRCGCGWEDDDQVRIQRALAVLKAAKRVVTPETRAAQRETWRAALSAHNAGKRRGRTQRPSKPITGFVIRPRRGDPL